MSDSASEDDGVIGYQARNWTPAIMQPIAAAALPSMMILPAVAFIRSKRKGSRLVRFFCAQSRPPRIAFMLISTAAALLLNCLATAFSISAMSMSSSHAATPT